MGEDKGEAEEEGDTGWEGVTSGRSGCCMCTIKN